MPDELRESVTEALGRTGEKRGVPLDNEAPWFADAAIPVVLAWLREQVDGLRVPGSRPLPHGAGYNVAIGDVLNLLDQKGGTGG